MFWVHVYTKTFKCYNVLYLLLLLLLLYFYSFISIINVNNVILHCQLDVVGIVGRICLHLSHLGSSLVNDIYSLELIILWGIYSFGDVTIKNGEPPWKEKVIVLH